MTYYETKKVIGVNKDWLTIQKELEQTIENGWELTVVQGKDDDIVYTFRRELPWRYDFIHFIPGGDYHDYIKEGDMLLKNGWILVCANSIDDNSMMMFKRNDPEADQELLEKSRKERE